MGREPADQEALAFPRFGFFGVIDERLDTRLVEGIARSRPHWQLVLIGPVVKIDPASLPDRANIHYLGSKSYSELPAYIRGWSAALLPFVLAPCTRFISPTKTPEYLAAGKPVVSTPIRDVIRPYADQGLVDIAGDAEGFVAHLERRQAQGPDANARWLNRVDEQLSAGSWEATWAGMESRMLAVMGSVRTAHAVA
jgi:UDP-galactopyranose mutase